MTTENSLSDFPDRLSPILVRELRQKIREGNFLKTFWSCQAIALITVLGELIIGETLNDFGITAGATFFYFCLWLVFGLTLPLSHYQTLEPETSAGRNNDLLLMANVTRWKVVLGKLQAGLAISLLLISSLIPYFFIRYFIGGIPPIEILLTIGSLLGVNALGTAIIIGTSAFRSHLSKFFWIALIVINMLITMGLFSTGAGAVGSTPGIHSILAMFASGVLFSILALQVGRSRLRATQRHGDPSMTAIMAVLIVACPFAVGILQDKFSIAGGWIAVIGMMATGLLIDPDSPWPAKISFARSKEN